MFCSNCGAEVSFGEKFCGSCGTKIEAAGYVNQGAQGYANPPIQRIPVRKKSNGTVITIVVVAVVLFLSGFGGYSAYNSYMAQKEISEATDELLDSLDDIFGDASSSEKSSSKSSTDNSSKKAAGSTAASADASIASTGDSFGNPPADDDPFANYKDLTYTSYAFANMAYDDDSMYITPNGTVNDNTVLYNGKTVGAFADYVDNKVLEKGRKLDRQFLYDMISVNVIDPSLSTDTKTFESSMIYLLTVTNEFYSTGARVEALKVGFNDKDNYRYKVKAYGKDDVWVANGQDKCFWMGNGHTEYHSSMYDDETLTLWLIAVDEFFGIE